MEAYSAFSSSASLSHGDTSSFALSSPATPSSAALSGPSVVGGWIDALILHINGLGVREVAQQVGLRFLTSKSIGPCPACHAERRNKGGTQGPGAIGFHEGRNSWECHRCKANGDPVELASWALLGTAKPRSRWHELQQRFFGRVAYLPRTINASAPQPTLTQHPDPNEVRSLWQLGQPTTQGHKVSAWLQGRGLDPQLLHERDLARVIPRNPAEPLPDWAAFGRGRSWATSGYCLVVPLFDEKGQLASLRARTLNQARDLPKEICPKDFSVAGLVFANAPARALLDGTNTKASEVVIVEGLPDFLTWATRGDLAVFGVFQGAWSKAIADRIPTGSRVVFRYHQDHNAAGEKLAAKVLDTLKERCQTFIPAYLNDPTKDDNERLQAGSLPRDPFEKAIQYADTISRNQRVKESYQTALREAFHEATKDPALSLTDGRAALFTALADALHKDGITVLHGDCGVGKTTALTSFAKQLSRQGKTVLLAFPTLKLARQAREMLSDIDTELYFAGPTDERCTKPRSAVLAHLAAGLKSREICFTCPNNPKNGGACTLALGREGSPNAKIRIATHQGIAAAALGVDVLFIDEAAAPSEVKTIDKKSLEALAASPTVLAGGQSPNGTRQTLARISQALVEAEDKVSTFEAHREELLRLAQEDHGKPRAKVWRAEGAEPNGHKEHNATFTDDTAQEILSTAHKLLEAAVMGAKLTPTNDEGLCFVASTPLAKVITKIGRAVLVSATPHDPKRLEAATGLPVHTVRIRLKDNAHILRTLFADKSGTLKALAPHGRPDFEKKESKRAIAYLLQWLKDNPIQRLLLGSYKPIGLAVLLAWKERHHQEPTESERGTWYKLFDGKKSAAQKALKEASTTLKEIFDLLAQRKGELGVVWYGDEAGSNAYQDFDAVATLGDAFPNLDAARLLFAQAYQREQLHQDGDAEFQRFYEEWARSAISQTHGRLRDAVREKTGYHFHFGRLIPQGWEQVQTFAKAPGAQKLKNLTSNDVAETTSQYTQGWEEVVREVGGMHALSRLLEVNRSTLENYAYGRREAPTQVLEKIDSLKKMCGGHGLAIKKEEPTPAPQVNPREGGYSQAVATTKTCGSTAERRVNPRVTHPSALGISGGLAEVVLGLGRGGVG
jgi:hypothetical protein